MLFPFTSNFNIQWNLTAQSYSQNTAQKHFKVTSIIGSHLYHSQEKLVSKIQGSLKIKFSLNGYLSS